jgi:hypothetical protein
MGGGFFPGGAKIAGEEPCQAFPQFPAERFFGARCPG